jgi:hypothetical protein
MFFFHFMILFGISAFQHNNNQLFKLNQALTVLFLLYEFRLK